MYFINAGMTSSDSDESVQVSKKRRMHDEEEGVCIMHVLSASSSANFTFIKPNSENCRKIKAILPFKVIQGHRFWYQSKAHIRLPILRR